MTHRHDTRCTCSRSSSSLSRDARIGSAPTVSDGGGPAWQPELKGNDPGDRLGRDRLGDDRVGRILLLARTQCNAAARASHRASSAASVWALMRMPDGEMAKTSRSSRLPTMANSTVARPSCCEWGLVPWSRRDPRREGREAPPLDGSRISRRRRRVSPILSATAVPRARTRAAARPDDATGDGVLHRRQAGVVVVGLDGRGELRNEVLHDVSPCVFPIPAIRGGMREHAKDERLDGESSRLMIRRGAVRPYRDGHARLRPRAEARPQWRHRPAVRGRLLAARPESRAPRRARLHLRRRVAGRHRLEGAAPADPARLPHAGRRRRRARVRIARRVGLDAARHGGRRGRRCSPARSSRSGS